jgi:MFS family permease
MAEPRYRWMIVAAGAVMGCIALGAMFSLPVLVGPIAKSTGWSTTGISGAMTVGFLTMAVGSFAWGALSDRIGARYTCLIGSLLMGTGLLLASRSRSVEGFQVAFGLLIGAGASAIFAPTMACVTGWFETQRSLAVSLVSVGFGVAPLTMSPWVAVLASRHDWREVLQILAIVVVIVLVPVALLVRRPPALRHEAAPGCEGTPGRASTGPAMSTGELLRSPQFLVLAATNFFCCATHSGPIFHTVSYAVTCGIPLVTAVTIYSVEGLAGLGGRVAFGLAGDRFGAHRMLVTGLLMQAAFALCYYFVNQLNGFYVVAALFGFTYGGTMPLYASLARDNFPLRMMGTVIGGVSTLGSLGMATGPVLGGWLYDRFGSYGWLYLAACGFGIVAVLMAMTFTPARKAPVAALAAG